MKKRNNMAKLDTASKAGYRLLELKRVYDLMASKKAEDLTPRQRSWLQKIGDFLGNNGIGGVGAPANGIAAGASAVTPNDWRMPRWGSTNATRPNPLLNMFYPSTFGQGKAPEPDSGQINNSFNMDERIPTFSEVNNRHYANGDGVKINYGPDKNGRHVFDEADSSVFAHMLFGPATYGIFTTPALATDAIGTVYASIRNGYNAIADYYNKHKSDTGADKGVEDYLKNTKKQIDEAEKYYNKIAEARKNYVDYYLPGDTENTDYPSFDDYVRDAVDADTLYYINTKLDKWADDVNQAAIDQAVDYNNSKKIPTKSALKTRDQIMLGLGRNPYAVTRSVIEPVEYLGD